MSPRSRYKSIEQIYNSDIQQLKSWDPNQILKSNLIHRYSNQILREPGNSKKDHK